MSCYGPNPNPFPPDFDTIPEIEKIRIEFNLIEHPYQALPAVRAVVLVTLVTGIAVGVLALNGGLATFPQQVSAWFHNLNWTSVAIGSGGFVILSIGAGVVIKRVVSADNELTESNMGKFSGSSHWQSAYYIRKGQSSYCRVYIDTSTLDESGSGYALLYGRKDCVEHYQISTVVSLATPLHAVATIAYHIVRLVVIPFYILGRLAGDAYSSQDDKQTKFELTDIPKQWLFSIKQIAKTPFFATAHLYALLYSYLDPLNGRKLGAAIEKAWNGGVDRSDGFWSLQGPQSPDWRLEGGGEPEQLGKNGFFLAGCHTPMGRVKFKNGSIVSGESMTRALHDGLGRIYMVTTVDTLREQNNAIIRRLQGEGDGSLEEALDSSDELGGSGTVDDTVIDGEG